MSITDAIKDMEKHMGVDFSEYLNEPLPHNEQAYIQRDYKTGTCLLYTSDAADV